MVCFSWMVLLLMCGVLADKGTKSDPDEKNNPWDKQSLEETPNQVQTTKEEEKVQPNIIFVLVRQSLIATALEEYVKLSSLQNSGRRCGMGGLQLQHRGEA